MTISLAIDTSTSRTCVAVIDRGGILWHGFEDGAMAHGGAVPLLVEQALVVAPLIEQVVVGMGPGPFTGLRVGIAFARTFALARTIPVLGVCSLDAIAAQVPEEDDFIIATDARRKEVYWALYRHGMRIDGPHVGSPSIVAEMAIPIFGEGAVKYSLSHVEEFKFPNMASLVLLAENSAALVDEPMYIRRPDAVPTSERAS